MSLKSFIKTAAMAGLPYGLFMGLTSFYEYGWERFFFDLMFSGPIFGLLMALFVQLHKSSRKNTIKYNPPHLAAGENILFDEAAAYTSNNTRLNGWLFLTDENLIFSEIKSGAVKQNLYFPLKDIFKVKPAMEFVVFPTGLRVFSQYNLEKFAVDDRKEWSRRIEQAARLKLKK